MTRKVVLAVLAVAVSLGAVEALAQQQPRGQQQGFQRPAQERRIDAGESDDEVRRRAVRTPQLPESIEDRLYFRERPGGSGGDEESVRHREIERLLREREQLVRARRTQAITLLVEFVRREPENAPEMADALLRLAELRWEESRDHYLQAFAAWQRVPEENRGPEPSPDYRQAMLLYDRILERHREYERYDLVLYMKAYAVMERGDLDGALALYERILAEFPQSRFVPDAFFARAEHAFGQYQWETSLTEFDRVLDFPDSGLYDIALFKGAWCLWRLNRTREAATRFRQVLDLGRNRSRLTAEQRRRLNELQDEALDYLIQVFVEDETNTAQDVFRFLEEIGGQRYANRVLARLSETFMGQSRYERAVEAYTLLLQMDGSVQDAPEYQRQIAFAYDLMGAQEAHVIEALTTLATTYTPNGTWATQQGDAERVASVWQRVERTIRRQGLKYHEAGQNNNPRQFEFAVAVYQLYLQHFAGEDEAYEIQFYMAEILFHRLRRFPEAGDAYLRAVEMNGSGRYTRDALYNAIGAFEQVREGEIQRCLAQPHAQGEEPVCDETDNDRKFSHAIELYVQLFPNDPDLPEILFRQGRLYYDRGIFDPAVRLFGQLLERFPENRWAEPAGELILDSFNRARDYANIEAWARRLKSAPAFASAEQQRRLDQLILTAMFRVGEQLAERGEHAAAADAYYRAAEEFPTNERARQAYFNAGLERQRAGDLSGAAEAYDRLIERHPGSSEGALGCWNAAQMYESIAQFSDAARYYETYSTRFGSQQRAEDALYNAVLLRVTAGDNDAAVDDGQRYLQQYRTSGEADNVTFFIGRAQEANEDWSDAAETYRRFIRQTHDLDRKVEAMARLAAVLRRGGDGRAANRTLEETVALGRRNAARLQGGRYYAAQARYLQGDEVMARYEAIQISGEMDGLESRLTRKSELLREAAEIYADVVEFQVAEYVTAALFQIGRGFEHFAEQLRETPVPDTFTEDQVQIYQDQLNMFIIPMEERALEAYEGGYQRALELRIFNRWTARLREGLTRLNDVQYPPIREIGGEIDDGAPLAAPEAVDGLRRGERRLTRPAPGEQPANQQPTEVQTTPTNAAATAPPPGTAETTEQTVGDPPAEAEEEEEPRPRPRPRSRSRQRRPRR